MGLTDDIVVALRSAPEAYQDPSLAVSAAAAGGDVQQNAEVTAHLLNTQATGNAVDAVATHHGGHGLLGATLGWLGGGIKGATDLIGSSVEKVGHLASMPLSDVQHQYRYLRDVESKHGFGAMLEMAIPMAAGGLAAGLLSAGNPNAIILGAEGAGALADRLRYKDSWARTNSATYVDPHGGQQISPGRDAARFIDSLSSHVGVHIEQHKGFDLYDAVSGFGDALFDIQADPLMKAGALHKAAVGEEGLRGVLATKWGGTAIKGADLAKVTAQYPSVERALGRIAGMDAGQIIAMDKRLTPFAEELGAADTVDKVGQVFQDKLTAAQMRSTTLPRQSFVNAAFKDLVGAAKERASSAMLSNPVLDETGQVVGREGAGVIARRVGRTYSRVTTFVPTSFNEVTQNISRTTMYFDDPSAARTIYDMAKWGHTEGMAQAVAKDFAMGNIQRRMTIFRNVMTDNLVNRMEAVQAGWTETAEGQEAITQMADRIDTAFGGIDAGRTTPWGFDAEGHVISKMVVDGETVSHPVLAGQHYNVPLPDYMTFDANLRSFNNGSKALGGADDFLYRHFTQNVFKKWVLASGGFALRVASGELLPALAKDSYGVFKGKITQAMAEHGWQLEAGEEEHLAAPIVRFMASKTGVTDEQITALANNSKLLDGHYETPAVRSGHGQGHEIIGREEYVKDSIYNLKKEVPKSVRVTDDVAAMGPEKDDQWVFHHKQAFDLSQDPSTRAAAAAYRDRLAQMPVTTEAHAIASKAADEAADAAVRRAASAKAGGAAAEEKLTEAEIAAKRAAGKAARDVVAEEIPPAEGGAAKPKSEKPKAPLSPELQAVYDRARQEAYTAAHKAATAAQQTAHLADAERAAIDAAQGVLDETPDHILDQQVRHFTAPDDPDVVRRAKKDQPDPEGTWKWVKSETAEPGKPSVKPHWEYQPHDPGAPLVSPVKVAAGHYEYQATEGTYTIKKTGATWTMTSPSRGEQEFGTWGKAVESMSRTTARAPEFFEGSLEMPGGYTREFEEPPAPAVIDPHQAWAQTQVENLKGTIRGQDGTLHNEILDAIAEGRAPNKDYMEGIPVESRPARVMGHYEKLAAPDRLTDRIFNKLNGVINWMAREPIYQNEFLKQFDFYKPLVDQGVLTYDEALVKANIRATNNMLPHIHNINERTLMAEHSRNFIPFYFAQQQSYARMFRLLATDPQAFRKVQLAYTNLANFGGIYGDNGSGHQLIMPGSGFVSGAAMGILSGIGIPVAGSMPTAFSGNLKSLASLSPFLEGGEVVRAGPLVSIAVRGINNLLPETRQLTDPIMGPENQAQSIFDMVVPNAPIRNVVKAFAGSDNRSQMKSVLDAVQSLEYQQNVAMRKWTDAGKDPNDPKAPHLVPSATATDMERQDFLNKVKNQARILTIFKSILGAVSPVAPSLQLGDYKLKDELYNKMKEVDPATGKPIGIAMALQDFLLAHPDATPYTVFETDAGTPSPIESTHPAQQWVTENMGFIKDKRYSAAASYFVPQTTDPFNQQVYNDQMAMGLRHTKAPDQLIKDIHTSEGNRWYFDVYKPAKDAAVAAAKSPHERNQISSDFTKNGDPAKGIQSFDSMKLSNPIWYTNFSSGGRDTERQLALTQMQTAIDSGNAPDSPMTSKIQDLLQAYKNHSLALLPGRTDTYASAQRTAEKANWQRYLKKTADEEPDVAMVINNVFRGV